MPRASNASATALATMPTGATSDQPSFSPLAVPNRSALAPATLVDELARSGVRDACLAPGSRSAPLASALIAHGGIRLWSHVDERSGGYFALGLARAARRPVAIVCTSGTAVANLLPAVVEAYHARLPLVVVTADRPPELRDCGAGQTIDQLGVFGAHARWFFDLGVPEADARALRHVRAVACRAVAVARGDLGGPPGPVHLNVPLREPLDPRPEPADASLLAALASTGPGRGRADAAPWTRVGRTRPAADDGTLEHVAALLRASHRPLVVAGPLDDADPVVAPAVAALCATLRAPLVAELASNLRRAPLLRFLVDAHDAVLRARPFADAASSAAAALRPDAVVRIGGAPTSKALAEWLAALDGVPQVVIDPAASWADPASVASHLLAASPAAVCTSLVARLGSLRALRGRAAHDDGGPWRDAWREAGRRARTACSAHVGDGGSGDGRDGFEAHVVLALASALPADALLYGGNSLAIRALDAFWPGDAPQPRVLANRGANGIDGFVSSVLGAAAGVPGAPVVGLCGDLSFYHDLNGLLAARRYGLRAVLVVLDNDGGGIFDHLPIARHARGFAEHFTTPHGLDFVPIVEAYGLSCERVARAADLAPALARALDAERGAVVVVRIDRARSLAAWGAARAAAVRAAEDDAPAGDPA